MQRQNYLIAGLITALLIGVLLISGCPQIPPTNGGAPPANGGAPPADGGLPLVDVTSGTEPVARYPGSIMLANMKTTYPEGAGFSLLISYGTAASIDTVGTWYKDMLENAGWEFAGEVEVDGAPTISYLKEDTQESITIILDLDEAGDTYIVITYTTVTVA